MMNLTKNQKIGLAVLAVAAVGYYMWEKSKTDAAKDAAAKAPVKAFANAGGFKKNWSK